MPTWVRSQLWKKTPIGPLSCVTISVFIMQYFSQGMESKLEPVPFVSYEATQVIA